MLTIDGSGLETVANALVQVRDLLTSATDTDLTSSHKRQKAAASILDKQIANLTNLQASLSAPEDPGHGNSIRLPTDVLLDVLGCLTYNDVVRLVFASRQLRSLAQKYVENQGRSGKIVVIDVEKDSIGVWLYDAAAYRLVFKPAICTRASCGESCDDPLCSKVHLAEAAVKIRNLVGFNRIHDVRIWGSLNDILMSVISKYLPFVKTFTSVDLTSRANGERPDATDLYKVLEFFEGLSQLTLRRLKDPFDWTLLRDPRMSKLKYLHISGLSAEPDSKEFLRYCRLPCSADPSTLKHVRFTETPLGIGLVSGLCRVVDSAKHKIQVLFEHAGNITMDDIPFKTEIPHKHLTFASRRSTVIFFRTTDKNGRSRYIITNDHNCC